MKDSLAEKAAPAADTKGLAQAVLDAISGAYDG